MKNCSMYIIKYGIKLAIYFEKEPVYNKRYLKIKIKYYDDKINTIFHDNILPGEGSHFSYLLVTDYVLKMGKNYYPNVFLEECKCIIKDKRMSKFINDELTFFSDEAHEEVSAEESNAKSINNKSINQRTRIEDSCFLNSY